MSESNSAPDRLPPYNMEAEIGMLGSILIDQDVLHEVRLHVRPEDCYRDVNGKILARCFAMADAGTKIDLVTIQEELKRSGDLEAIGGLGYLLDVVKSVPHAANAVYYAQIVAQNAVKREAIHACNQTLEDIYSNQFTAEEVMDAAEGRIFAIGQERRGDHAATIGGLMAGTMDGIRRTLEGEVDGIASGLDALDEIVGGFKPGQLIVVGARPSMGKSALLLKLAEHIVGTCVSAFYLASLEMSQQELANRWLTSMARVNNEEIRRCRIDDDDMARLIDAAERSKPMPLTIDDAAGRTAGQIVAAARVYAARLANSDVKFAAMGVDYLQLLDRESTTNRNASTADAVAHMSRRLKVAARELNVPVFVLSQLNRAVEARPKNDRRPHMSDLRDSGGIEQDADVVILIHRPEYYDPNDEPGIAELIVAKNRGGATGIARVAWIKQFTRFENLSNRDYQ